MKKILFVCLGNICRSPMAEMILTQLLKVRHKKDVLVASRATSRYELGNGIDVRAATVLRQHDIELLEHHAQQITRDDFDYFDEIYVMDRQNLETLITRFGKFDKIRLLNSKDILDPWYSGNFEVAFCDIMAGCLKIVESIDD